MTDNSNDNTEKDEEIIDSLLDHLKEQAEKIINKSQEEKMSAVTEAAVSKRIDLSQLVPTMKSCVLMLDESGNPVTKHSTALVPLCHICNEPVPFRKDTGKLADIAPTLLTLMGLDIPAGMEGDILV